MPSPRAKLKTVLGQPSWRLATNDVELFLTRTGGHLAPATFFRADGKRAVSPFAIAPWATEKRLHKDLAPVLVPMRGDFFCLPFGGNDTPWHGERHPAHGETATGDWTLASLETTKEGATLVATMDTAIRPGRVEKRVVLKTGHQAIYQRHTVTGMSGPMPFGHHAVLQCPAAEGSVLISTSRFLFGATKPTPFENPAIGGYPSLAVGVEFRRLNAVPRAGGGMANLSAYPAWAGFEDFALLASDPALPFAWTAAAFHAEGYVWLGLKNPRQLAATTLWMSNGGRHYAPWNGRHRARLGLEEVTGYFECGLAESAAANSLSRRGVKTHEALKASRPFVVSYIMTMARTPRGFGRVRSIRALRGNAGVRLSGDGGKAVDVPVDLAFLDA